MRPIIAEAILTDSRNQICEKHWRYITSTPRAGGVYLCVRELTLYDQRSYAALVREGKKALRRTLRNPLPICEGGYGKPLGSKGNCDLTGLLKIKLKKEGLRVVYKLIRQDGKMLVIVVGIRDDEEVYRMAEKRAKKCGL